MHPRRLIASLSVVLTPLLLAAACASGPPPRKPRKPTILATEYDDARVGQESSQGVAAQVGLLGDAELDAYVGRLGRKLLRGVPRRSFEYQFLVVDQLEPNAFALPGGYIFVSRGLLALASSEDELACVLGHEITHAAARHAAAQQALARRQTPLVMGWMRAAALASYGRDMERDADRGGQILAAAAGYDPMALSTFLRKLEQVDRLTRGFSRRPSFFDTHPGSQERAAVNAARSAELRWKRDPSLGDTRTSYLRRLEGLPVGERPEAGVFEGDVFLHPVMDFQLRFPHGWSTTNTTTAVGAVAPRGEAVVFLEADPPAGSAQAIAERQLEKLEQEARAELVESGAVKLGDLDAWRMRIKAKGGGGSVAMVVVAFPYREAALRITGMTHASAESRYLGRFLSTARSFRPLAPEERAGIRSLRLALATARAGEGLVELSRRTGNVWDPSHTAVYNGIFSDHRFEGGELVKLARAQPFVAQPR